MNKITIASINFVDMRSNTGPGVNESEFNSWLLKTFDDAVVYSPFASESIEKGRRNRVREFGKHSLRTPLRMIKMQFVLARRLAKELSPGVILYYRHSRLIFIVALLQQFRPDIKVAMTRTHPAGSDDMINRSLIKRMIARIISRVDDKLRIAVARRAYWVDCVTQRQAEKLEEETGRRIEVVMNGVNTDIFKPLSNERRAEVRAHLGIPEGANVVGYCGGFPEQRGAKEISALTAIEQDFFGVVIGKLSDKDRISLAHDRILFLGEIDYQKVSEIVGVFDVAVALDVPGRSVIAGNSNQKVRQGLAAGAWVLTQAADLPFEEQPHLGINISSRDTEHLAKIVRENQGYFSMREDRSAYARSNLSTYKIFQARHDSIVKGLFS